MNIKQFVVNPFGVNCFVLSNDAGDAILIDPSVSNEREEDALARYIEQNHLTVRHLLNTHLHLDHVLGNAFVARKYGVQLEAHEEDAFLLDLQEEQSQMFGLPMREPSPGLGNSLAEGDAVEVPGIRRLSCPMLQACSHHRRDGQWPRTWTSLRLWWHDSRRLASG